MSSPKRVLIIAASPRSPSNSSALALKAAEGVKAYGGVPEIVQIGSMKIAPCNACDACRSKEARCVIEDDMQLLYPKIMDADAIIFATPVYWFNVSAQMKLFIDRTYAMRIGDKYGLTGKDTGVILTYEDEDVYKSGGVNALRSFQDIFRYVDANQVGSVYGKVDKLDELDDELLEKAYELGGKITCRDK